MASTKNCDKLGKEWSYKAKTILAPMVHVNTLPFRILARGYGADIVCSEEILDFRIEKCSRVENKSLGTIDFYYQGGREEYGIHGNHLQDAGNGNLLCFRTIPEEPVVFQIGSCDAVAALRGATVVCKDVKAIDLNCGCPKPFSVDRGYGAALVQKPDLLKDIVSTLSRNLPIPITAKIRLHHTLQGSMQLCKAVESGGGSAIAIHARFTEDRPNVAAIPRAVLPLANSVQIPVIYNGDGFNPRDLKSLLKKSGCDSIMLARGAMWNASLFRTVGNGQPMLPPYDVARRYLKIAQRYENSVENSRKNLACMMSFRKMMGAKGVRESAEKALSFTDLETAVDAWEAGREHFMATTNTRKQLGSNNAKKKYRAPLKLVHRKFEWKKEEKREGKQPCDRSRNITNLTE